MGTHLKAGSMCSFKKYVFIYFFLSFICFVKLKNSFHKKKIRRCLDLISKCVNQKPIYGKMHSVSPLSPFRRRNLHFISLSLVQLNLSANWSFGTLSTWYIWRSICALWYLHDLSWSVTKIKPTFSDATVTEIHMNFGRARSWPQQSLNLPNNEGIVLAALRLSCTTFRSLPTSIDGVGTLMRSHVCFTHTTRNWIIAP